MQQAIILNEESHYSLSVRESFIEQEKPVMGKMARSHTSTFVTMTNAGDKTRPNPYKSYLKKRQRNDFYWPEKNLKKGEGTMGFCP